MEKQELKGWAPPRAQEFFPPAERPDVRAEAKDYDRRDGDALTLVAEFPVAALPRKAAWKEAVRTARAVVRNYPIGSAVVMFFPKTEDHIFERVRVFQRFNRRHEKE